MRLNERHGSGRGLIERGERRGNLPHARHGGDRQNLLRVLRSSLGYTEVVLDANPDLALQPATLPSGPRITLPQPARVTARQPTIQLWE